MEDNNREAMLEGLKGVLEGVPGVRHVDRQAITQKMLSDRQMPAIIIDEDRTQYEWLDRHGQRVMKSTDTIGLDCQTVCKRGDFRGDPSTVRQAFAWQVINRIVNHSTLNKTCADAAVSFSVRYPDAEYPFARALIAIVIEGTEQFDDREQTVWQQLTMQTVEPQDGPEHTYTLG